MPDPEAFPARPWTISEPRTPAQLLSAAELFDDPVTPASAADTLGRPGHHLLVALTHENEPIGFISAVAMRHPDKPPEMFINELGVAEAWRRRGVALDLLRALAEMARARGALELWTATEPDNLAALATYRAAGARTDGIAVMVSLDLEQGTEDQSRGG